MTPDERDAIRSFAAAKLDLCSGSECGVECRAYRAILRYVPAGDGADLSITVDRYAVVVSLSEGIACSPTGARNLAHALHAAADAAEES